MTLLQELFYWITIAVSASAIAASGTYLFLVTAGREWNNRSELTLKLVFGTLCLIISVGSFLTILSLK